MHQCEHLKPISFFIPSLQGGGAQRVVVNLANALPDITEHPVHVVLAHRVGEFADELRPEVETIDLGTKRASRSIFALASYMRRERPQAMISTLNYANVIFLIAGLLAGKPCPLIVREANIVRRPTGSLGAKFRGYVTQSLMRLLYPRADKVVAICRDVQQSMLEAGLKIEDKLALIGNPVNLDPEDESEPLTLDWLPNPSPPFICAMGRLSEQKGFDTLLSAFAKLRDARLHLVILGEGPLRESLTQQAEELGIQDKVHMPGFIQQPRRVLKQAELFVLSSRWEGFVNVMLEALAAGVPVVSTNCPGAPRDILENGSHGHLVPYDDPEALAEGIKQGLKHPAGTPETRMARAADFSAEKIAKKYIEHILG